MDIKYIKGNNIFYFNYNYKKNKLDGPKPPLLIEIKDKNITSDVFIGNAVIDLTSTFENPCKWSIDHYFEISVDEKNK